MCENQKGSPTPADHEDNLRTAYEAACNRHRQIDDFRGKLLALLPIASGAAGLLLLLSKSNTINQYLTPIGLYGCAITVGLFLYELHGVSVCEHVMDQAGGLEKELHVPEGMRLFKDRKPDWGYGLVGPPMAAWVVYVSVFAGWLYLAGARGWWNHKSSEYFASPVYILAGAVAVLPLIWLIRLPQTKRRLEKWQKQKEQKKFTRFLQSEGWDIRKEAGLANGHRFDIVGTRRGVQLWVEVKSVIYTFNPAIIRQIAAQFPTPSGVEPGTKIRRALLLSTPPLISSDALRDFRENQIELWYASYRDPQVFVKAT